jgi:ABC-type glycerol-3-phosphate transport system substrate-binding protein
MFRFKKVLFVLFVLLIPVAFVLAGGETDSESSSEMADEVVELSVWFGRENFIPDDAFESFHQQYPNIKVNVDVIPLEQALTEAATALSAGVGPDILQTDSRRIPPLVEAGLLLPMDDQLALWKKEDPDSYKTISSAGWDHGIYNGVAYGLAIFSGPFNHVYRKDLLEEAGLDVPKTWEEMLEVARVLNDPPAMNGFAVRGPSSTVWFSSHYMSMGGTYDENNVIQLDSEAGIYALDFYQTLVEENLISADVLAWGSGDMRAAFITGRAAQAPIGNNIFPSIQEELEYGVEWAAVPPLYREGAESEYRYASLGWPMVATVATDHPYEVGLVLRYLAEHEPAMSVARRYQPTTVMTVWDDPGYIAEQPWAQDFSEALKMMVPTPPNLFITQMDQIVLDALGEVMSDTSADPAEVAARYQIQLDNLF